MTHKGATVAGMPTPLIKNREFLKIKVFFESSLVHLDKVVHRSPIIGMLWLASAPKHHVTL